MPRFRPISVYVFENHQGGTLGFAIACQRLGISKADWDYANNEAGFYALVGIVGQQLGVPRYDPAASKARRETLIGLMKSPEAANQRSKTMEKAAKETRLLLDRLTDDLSHEGFNIAQRASRMRRDGSRRSSFLDQVRKGRVGCILISLKLRLKRFGWQKLLSFAS